jgi:hypothetical protein
VQAEPAKCTNCGGSEFEWGWVHPRSFPHDLIYSQMDESRIMGRKGWRVKSRRCQSCNHIAFFCDTQRSPLILWPRFSLRALLVATTIIAMALALIIYASRN